MIQRELTMHKVRLGRYTAWIACIALFALAVAMHPHGFWGWTLTAIPAALARLDCGIGFRRVTQCCAITL